MWGPGGILYFVRFRNCAKVPKQWKHGQTFRVKTLWAGILRAGTLKTWIRKSDFWISESLKAWTFQVGILRVGDCALQVWELRLQELGLQGQGHWKLKLSDLRTTELLIGSNFSQGNWLITTFITLGFAHHRTRYTEQWKTLPRIKNCRTPPSLKVGSV